MKTRCLRHGWRGCGKSRCAGERRTSGAKARTYFEWLGGTSGTRALPGTAQIGVFPQAVEPCPFKTDSSCTTTEPCLPSTEPLAALY